MPQSRPTKTPPSGIIWKNPMPSPTNRIGQPQTSTGAAKPFWKKNASPHEMKTAKKPAGNAQIRVSGHGVSMTYGPPLAQNPPSVERIDALMYSSVKPNMNSTHDTIAPGMRHDGPANRGGRGGPPEPVGVQYEGVDVMATTYWMPGNEKMTA